MKTLSIALTGVALISAPAFAGGRGGHNGGHGSNGLAVNANVLTGKGGVLGTLLGGNSGRRGY